MALIQGQTAILTHAHACNTNYKHALKNVHADHSIWKGKKKNLVPHQCPSRLLNVPPVLLFLSQGLVYTECRWTYMCQQPLCEISVMALGLCDSMCACCGRVWCLLPVLYCLAQGNCLHSGRTMHIKGCRRKRLELTSFTWLWKEQQQSVCVCVRACCARM